ncbi:hypothetical protein DICPUDRAFT_88567 [Dictyostelium purpureum]|uniref:PX domain-containing protein n=1 Tax=Dictyostelium purpureum TaxID=5786 RepID=F0ZQ57_DICPU|nr:uncharacterized protein DICPUDRAFT_88567 [Dictyostelium purpureum]EGC33926.1 hypothetical protein DICPUDRAFT_88567 [Dictyostelium purpureum]|eukprot:XP_003289561.1 hypothetical protein DICPUDRAFT_88567 [Dictyostelium purpureum]
MEENVDVRNVSIMIAENREQYGKKFTEYIIDVTTSSGSEYTIARRFSEFFSLYELLVHNFQIQFQFPPKKLNKFSGNIIEARKKSLQDFLKFLVIHPSLSVRKSSDLSRFLDQNTPNFNNKLTKEKVTFEEVNQKKKSIKLELSIVEGRDFKIPKKSMWDIVSFVMWEVGHEPDPSTVKSSNKTPLIAGPYPRFGHKTRVTIKKDSEKILYFKIFNKDTGAVGSAASTHGGADSNHNSSSSLGSPPNSPTRGNNDNIELIGTCSIDIEKLQITNQSPTLHVLQLEPEAGEIVISLVLV